MPCFGIVAPAKTPASTTMRLIETITAAVNTTEIKSWAATQGLTVSPTCGSAFGAFLKYESAESARVIQESGVKSD